MPRQAWSSFTGSWRLVEIKKSTKSGFVGPIMALGIAAFLGLVLAIPNRLTFDGQVIARWQETSDESSSRTPYYAQRSARQPRSPQR